MPRSVSTEARRWPLWLAAVVAAALALLWAGVIRENQRLAQEYGQRYATERQVVTALAAESLVRQLQRLDDALLLLRNEYLNDRPNLPRTIQLLRQGPLLNLAADITFIGRDGYAELINAQVDAGGRSVPPSAPKERLYLGDRGHFRHFVGGGTDSLFVDGPVMGRISKRPGIQISRPIIAADGRFAGVVAVFVAPEQFTSFMQQVDLGLDGVFSIVSESGVLLSRSKDLDQSLGRQIPPQLFASFLRERQGLITRPSILDGVRRTVAYRWLDAYPLLVIVAASPKAMEAEVAGQQGKNLLVAALLTLLVLIVGLFLGFHLRRRDQLESLLAQERAHLVEAQRVAHLGSWDRDLVANRLWWSDEIYRILDFNRSQCQPSYEHFLSRVAPVDRARIDAAFTRTREAGAPLDERCRLQLPGGVTRHVHVSGRVERDELGRPLRVVGTLQDVSETQGLQQAVQDAEERWKYALEGARDGVWDWFVAEQRAYLSPRWKEILGYADHELPSRHQEWLERLHPEDKDRVLGATADYFAGRLPVFEQEFRLRHRDGTYRWILSRGQLVARDEAGRPLRMLGTITDITERKQAALAMAESEALQRSLVSALAEGVVVQDAQGQIISANVAARRILQLSEEQLLGRTSTDPAWNVIRENGQSFPPEEHPSMVTLHTGVSCDNVVMGVVVGRGMNSGSAAGSRVWLSVNSRPLVQPGEVRPYAVVTSFADITEVKAAELSNRLYRDVLERAGRAILITDVDGRINNVNSAFVSLLGYSREEALGQKAGFYRSNRHPRSFFQDLWQSLMTRGEWRGEIWNRCKGGEAILLEADIRAVTNAEGGITQFVAVYQDVTDLRQAQEDMWHRAHYDPLTGLPNRSLFLDRLDQALVHAERQGERLGLLYLDLDGFKAINDTEGHQAGDALLQEVGLRLMAVVRSSDTAARLAGDEFAVLLPHLSVEDDLQRVMRIIADSLSQPVVWQGLELQVGVSIGSAIYPEQAANREELIRVADSAMYRIKRAASNVAHPDSLLLPPS
ncbi:MAG: PAS domain S-box protein [Betaproteobacteria bacterium]|nr:PAS domain S-box protein [Betaproteobacteria bacterium]